MKYLGIDYGSKRVGLALSNAEGTIAFPRTTLPNDDALSAALMSLLADEHVEGIVVGDARAFSGLENPVTKDAENFAKRLGKTSGVPVKLVWEAGSTLEASRYAEKGNEHSDAAAAAVILQRFLDSQSPVVE